jgi:hypothetical protein
MTAAESSGPTGPTVVVVRRPWGRHLLLWLLVSVLALGAVVGAIGAAAWQTVPELSQALQGLRISIDGHHIDVPPIDPMHVWVAGIVLVAGLALLLALLPLALAVAALAVSGGVVMGLLAAAGVVALVLSPLIAAGALGWWLLHRRKHTTMSP